VSKRIQRRQDLDRLTTSPFNNFSTTDRWILKRSVDKKLPVNAREPRPLAATRQSADYGWNRNCRREALSIDSTQHLLNWLSLHTDISRLSSRSIGFNVVVVLFHCLYWMHCVCPGFDNYVNEIAYTLRHSENCICCTSIMASHLSWLVGLYFKINTSIKFWWWGKGSWPKTQVNWYFAR